MSLRLLRSNSFFTLTSNSKTLQQPLAAPISGSKILSSRLQISTIAMSRRPNFQGGRRGGRGSSSSVPGRGGGGRGGRGGGGGGRGEQRWWDPVWRAERLRQKAAEASNSVKELQSFRKKLPAYKVKGEFLNAVSENQVLVISGETGCGKTTQLPQYILEEEIARLCGAHCSIICTQPRRISAISVAARISSERGENLGETVGYQIRLEAKRSDQTRLLFCTTGVLLRQLVQDPDLTGVSHLLVDEIHERGMNEDFLLIILRDLLPRRPDLRLILMSATINANLFSKYFGNAQIIHIPGLTFPVTELFLEDILEKSRYKIQSEAGSFQGNSRRRKREQDSKKDPLTELFEAIP